MILTEPTIFLAGVDKVTRQPVISITAPDAPPMAEGATQPNGVSLVFADVQALRVFGRRVLAAAYVIGRGEFVPEPEQPPAAP